MEDTKLTNLNQKHSHDYQVMLLSLPRINHLQVQLHPHSENFTSYEWNHFNKQPAKSTFIGALKTVPHFTGQYTDMTAPTN
jgi:hypothetical protein